MILFIIGVIIIVLASFLDGVLEGYGFDGRTSFERLWNIDPHSFFGHLSWERLYTNPNLWNKYMGVFDFYHVADDLRKLGYIGGSSLLLINKPKHWKFYFLIFGIVLILSSLAKWLGMLWVRHT